MNDDDVNLSLEGNRGKCNMRPKICTIIRAITCHLDPFMCSCHTCEGSRYKNTKITAITIVRKKAIQPQIVYQLNNITCDWGTVYIHPGERWGNIYICTLYIYVGECWGSIWASLRSGGKDWCGIGHFNSQRGYLVRYYSECLMSSFYHICIGMLK